MIKYVFLLFFIFTSVRVLAQDPGENRNNGPGELKISQDERVDMLISRYRELKSKSNAMPGFRIQIFFGSGRTSREKALDSKARFLSDFPDYPAYILYETPYYKVRVGDFRTKREAAFLYRRLKRDFPEAYITPLGKINLPPLPENEKK